MKKFIRLCLLLCLPLVIMVLAYVIIDPFKVVWHYDSYYKPDEIVELNREYVSAMHYKNHLKEYGYDSFIFGNSRSRAFQCEEWKQYLPKSSVCYHFDSHFGSVKDLLCGIKFIKEKGKLRHALLIVDCDKILCQTERDWLVCTIPPILKDGNNAFEFQAKYFKAFYKFDFLLAYIDYRISNEYKPRMVGYLINKSLYPDYDLVSNDEYRNKQENLIKAGDYYDSERIKAFEKAQSPGKVSEVVLNDERIEMLKEIKSIFDAQMTDYKIVISPTYNQIRINPDDLLFLYDVFGQNNVYDFSGANQWNNDYHNFYETEHYRPCVANEIMQIIYGMAF